MTRTWWALLFVALSAVMACAQRSQPLDAGGCKAIDRTNGPFTCPNGASCGTYVTFITEECTIGNEENCALLTPISTCCGKYPNYLPLDGCYFTQMKDPRIRSRILELAQDSEILVPTCSGA